MNLPEGFVLDQGPAAPTAPAGAREPRGIRNNNPGNIEDGAFARSIPGYAGSDGRFARYDNPESGLSAIDRLLQTYAKKGIDTPAGIIGRWAPASDGNPVNAYASYVAQGVGIDPTAKLDMSDPNVRRAISQRIAEFENGKRSGAVQRQPLAPPPQPAQQPQQSGGLPEGFVLDNAQSSPQSPPVAPQAAANSGRPDVGRVTALGEGARSGALFNFGDELAGASAAGFQGVPNDPQTIQGAIAAGVKASPPVLAMSVPMGIGRMIAEKIMAPAPGLSSVIGPEVDRRGPVQKTYETERDRVRQQSADAQAQYPGTYIAGQVAGAVALPGGQALQAATLPGRIGRSMVAGGVFGGLSGVGEGETVEDRAIKGATGAALGTAVGGVAPVAIEGAVRGAAAVGRPIMNAVRGVTNTGDEAARRVALAVQRDMQSDPGAASRLTAGEFVAGHQAGEPVMIMDLGGETTRALARSAGNTSPEGRAVMNRAINDRYEGQTGRVVRWFNDTFNFPDAHAQQEALETAGKQINRVNYGKARQDGDRELISPEIERLLGSPAVVEAMQKASTSGRDRAVTEGFGAFNPGVTVENGLVKFRSGKNGQPTYPNLQFWDATKRELDDAAKAAAQKGRDGEAGVLGDLAKSLRTELDRLVPSYKQARAGASHFFGAENALEAGQKFVTENFAMPATRQALAKMSPTERQLFQDGFVSRYIETLNKVGDRRNIVNQIADNPAAREKIELVLGRQRAAELEAKLRVEGIMDLSRSAVQGNSTTARQLAELGLAGGTYGIGTGGDVMNPNPSALMTAALVWGAARGKNRINENLARRVADLLVSNDPTQLRRGIQLVTRNQQLFQGLRTFDKGFARVGAEQAPSIAPTQALGIGRADENQQPVPGPAGQ